MRVKKSHHPLLAEHQSRLWGKLSAGNCHRATAGTALCLRGMKVVNVAMFVTASNTPTYNV